MTDRFPAQLLRLRLLDRRDAPPRHAEAREPFARGHVGHAERFPVLDGWRGVSILLVLAAHLLPLGPGIFSLNEAAGVAGMAVFFTLSGFLITSILLMGATVPDFLTRRCFRVVPLAWLYLIVALVLTGMPLDGWLAHVFFYANVPPQKLVPLTAHLWSVCIEMQFYVFAALLVGILGIRALLALPVLCIAFTLLRVAHDIYASSYTWFRFDELLAGCMLALVYHGRLATALPRVLAAAPQSLLLLLFAISCLPAGWLYSLRPYLAAALVGATLFNPDSVLSRWLTVRVLAYLAAVSYALYVIHPLLAHTWLGSGDSLERYLKRPLLFVVLFALAHVSTHCFERRFIAFGRRMSTAVDSVTRSRERVA